MTRFHSKVVRVTQMSGKAVVNFKEKHVPQETPDKPDVDEDSIKIFDSLDEAEKAIVAFMTSVTS